MIVGKCGECALTITLYIVDRLQLVINANYGFSYNSFKTKQSKLLVNFIWEKEREERTRKLWSDGGRDEGGER